MKHITLAICAVAILLFGCNNGRKESRASSSDSASSTKITEGVPVNVDTTTVKFPTPGEFHEMLARSNGTWRSNGTMWFSPDTQPVDGGTSMLTNKMAMGGLYQISETKGNPGIGKPWTG